MFTQILCLIFAWAVCLFITSWGLNAENEVGCQWLFSLPPHFSSSLFRLHCSRSLKLFLTSNVFPGSGQSWHEGGHEVHWNERCRRADIPVLPPPKSCCVVVSKSLSPSSPRPQFFFSSKLELYYHLIPAHLTELLWGSLEQVGAKMLHHIVLQPFKGRSETWFLDLDLVPDSLLATLAPLFISWPGAS